jgi:hypothetical protein
VYVVRTEGYSKKDPEKRWALPDRVFFACGACHILAYAFLERFGMTGHQAVWIKPAAGHTGNHIFIECDGRAFDYHGYAGRERFLAHYWKRARHWYPDWDGTLVPLPADVLVSERKSRTYDGLWLREPGQFLHDALPRARAYLDRLPGPA